MSHPPMELCVHFSLYFLPLDFDHDLRFLEDHKPVCIEIFIPELAVETLD